MDQLPYIVISLQSSQHSGKYGKLGIIMEFKSVSWKTWKYHGIFLKLTWIFF